MTEYPVFKNAPITEALLDVKVTLPAGTDFATLASVQDRARDRYPRRKERMQWEIQAAEIDTADPLISRTGGIVGYLFLPPSEPPDRVFQARLDGFTFSKLRPYETWQAFRDEAKGLWHAYSEVTRPLNVGRIGLRTINSLRLPLPFKDFREYLLTIPEIAPGLPSGLEQFFMQVAIPQPAGEMAVVTSAMRPPQDPADSAVSVIFDIDVSVERTFLPDADAIWETCEGLRHIRNEIFFGSLTEKAKELF